VKPESAAARESEARTAKACLERPAVAGPSMEAVLERENLKTALAQVKRNKGAAGIDGMSVDALPAYLKEHWPTIRAQLLDGTYKPQPVRRVEIPKASGGVRLLGIPTVLDRLIQQAVMQVLQADWDPTFSETSFGFRPKHSAHQAVERAQAYIASGHAVVVDIDLEKFFDRVNHDILMGLVAKRVIDKRLLKLIRGFLNAGVMEGGLVSPTEEGTPQGGPLSPLLSNLMLDVLDKELEKRGHRFVRYADDCVPRTHRRKKVRNCVRDGGRSSGAGRQGQASNHRKLRRSKAGVVSVAEKAGLDPVRYGSERRARANR
jgi:RNA-directed DNA polymerase